MVIKNDKGKLAVRNLVRMHERKLMFLPPTRQAEERGQLVSFRESTARHNKVKTSHEDVRDAIR